jgi:hypothetical protein
MVMLMLIVPWLLVLFFCSDVFVVLFLFSFVVVIDVGATERNNSCFYFRCFVVLLLLC